MVRTLIIDDNLLSYLSAVADENVYAVGLIVGQSCLDKDYVVHFAKTPPFQTDEDKKAGKSAPTPKSLEDFNPSWVADHAKQATRMLPGGLYVLGIFITAPDDILNPLHSKIKSLLQTVQNYLNTNKYLYGNHSSEKVVLHFSSKTKKYYSRSYDVNSHNVQNVDVKSVAKRWTNVQCDIKLNKLRFLLKEENDWPLEKHIKIIMDEICDNLSTAVFLFDGEFKDKDEPLEGSGKKKSRNTRSNKGQESGDATKPVLVSILQTQCLLNDTEENIIESCGSLQLLGKVASQLWVQPKLTVSQVMEAVRQDILRSLASRLELHWDSLIEEENSEDINSVHEPPRRVLISLPDSDIALSDYLFPGEGPQDVKVSLEELLDITVDDEVQIMDVEGQADLLELDKYYKGALDSDSTEDLPIIATDPTKMVYIVGAISLIVLIIAILFNLF
ncbi:protein odr-4 homolog [Diabrotica virgifera virgifera]|uniref:Protein odr-4 homolog n=1 Tax=Diabrotica virgifera virgifera TaxID=50390 RepID=A0A6P7EX90_DIAVI|nr:protein odr-4 homolog [Diabrotica virgifera virgifera]